MARNTLRGPSEEHILKLGRDKLQLEIPPPQLIPTPSARAYTALTSSRSGAFLGRLEKWDGGDVLKLAAPV